MYTVAIDEIINLRRNLAKSSVQLRDGVDNNNYLGPGSRWKVHNIFSYDYLRRCSLTRDSFRVTYMLLGTSKVHAWAVFLRLST